MEAHVPVIMDTTILELWPVCNVDIDVRGAAVGPSAMDVLLVHIGHYKQMGRVLVMTGTTMTELRLSVWLAMENV